MVRREYKYARRNFSQSTRTRHRMSFCIGRYARRCNVYLILESNSEIFYIITKIFQRFWIELVILWILIYRSYWFFFFLSFYCDILVLFDICRNAIYIRQVLKYISGFEIMLRFTCELLHWTVQKIFLKRRYSIW